MKKYLLMAFALSFTYLNGGLEQSFKPVPDKSGVHSMRNIDFIYTINLDQRPEKFQQCLDELSPYGISPCRFSAVNGWEIPLDALATLGVEYTPDMGQGLWGTYYSADGNGMPSHEVMSVSGRHYFCHCMSRGAVGIVLSHLSILQDAYDSGYETIWVMEDDVKVIQDPHLLSHLIDRLDHRVGKKHWDILFTDQDTKGRNGNYVVCRSFAPRPNFSPYRPERFSWEPKKIDGYFRKIQARYGAYSMIIRRSGMKKILDFIKKYKIFLPYDMEFYLPDGINLYAVINDVVSTLPDALSDNGGPNYQQKLVELELMNAELTQTEE